jgi:hypothetical protein
MCSFRPIELTKRRALAKQIFFSLNKVVPRPQTIHETHNFNHFSTTHTSKDDNRTEISRTDRFRFLYYGSVFKHKKLSISIGFTTIFNHFLYSLIAKM